MAAKNVHLPQNEEKAYIFFQAEVRNKFYADKGCVTGAGACRKGLAYMEHIYIALVDTPGIFAAVIRRFLRQRYIHVVIGLDAGLEEAYSFGRRNPAIPWFAGFERERKEKILRAFPTAAYRICELECSEEQKDGILRRLRQDYQKRYHYHYAVPGLPFLAIGRSFYLKNQYTCSSYIARLLEEHGIRICGKHFSLVTPKDFYQYSYQKVVYEGSLAGFIGAAPTRTSERAVAYGS